MPSDSFWLITMNCLLRNTFGTIAVGADVSNSRPDVSRVNLPFSAIVERPTSADPPSRRVVAAGFQKITEASLHPPAVTAKPRPMAHDPISLRANPCAPARAGSRRDAVDQSNDRVARRSNMTILLKD